MSGPVLPSPMFKLDADCYEELFEWLSIKDLLALRRTCKRLQKVVDYHIKSNYPAMKIECRKIIFPEINPFTLINPISLKMIKDLTISMDVLTRNEANILKVIMSQLIKLTFNIMSQSESDLYELFLKWCSNLKHLTVRNIQSNTLIGNDNQWLLHHYPSLEHITLHNGRVGGGHYYIGPIRELKTFFELNPNIQVFSTTNTFLCANGDCFLESNIQIDRLNIDVHFTPKPHCTASELCILLNKLYDLECYKSVHLYCEDIGRRVDMDQIELMNGIEKLYLHKIRLDLIPPPMPNLRELVLYSSEYFKDMESIARNLVNLERVYIERFYVQTNSITPFLRYSPRLKEIKIGIKGSRDGTHFENGIVNLNALNNERSQLVGVTKVTIYIKESVFLRTKFAKTNIDLSLVRLKRIEAVDWTHEFRW